MRYVTCENAPADQRERRWSDLWQSYTADFDDIAGYTNFADGVIHVAQGDTVTGAVTFQLPERVKVAKVQWGVSSNFGSVVQWNVRR